MLRSRVHEDMDMGTDIRMDITINIDRMIKVDRPTPPPRRGRIIAILRALIHSELKLARQHQVAIITCTLVQTLVDPSRPQDSRGYPM
jgi:hypothetical protein